MYNSHTVLLTSAGKKFFGTKKRSLRIIEIDKGVELNDGYWDGGSRSTYHGLTKSGSTVGLSYPTSPEVFGGGKPGTVMPTDEVAIVRGGVFCGKIAGLTIYVNKLDGWLRPEFGTIQAKTTY